MTLYICELLFFFVFKYITYYMIFYAYYNDGKNVVWIDNLKKMISSPPGNFNWLQNTFFVQYVFSYIYTPETRYSKRACQTPFVYYIESFTISRQSISIKSHEGSWVLFTISRILLYRGLLYRVSGVLGSRHMYIKFKEFFLNLDLKCNNSVVW